MELHPGKALSELSPNDKPWDRHKAENVAVGALYGESLSYLKLQNRMVGCAPWLQFGEVSPGEVTEHDRKIKLQKAAFCRVRLCPVCAWRRSLALKARFLKNWEAEYKQICSMFVYIHIVFTVKNPPMSELRRTINAMNLAFKNLLKRKEVLPVSKGFIKSIEITKGKDNLPHPHFHVTMAVNRSYFTDHTYLSQKKWVGLWRDCLGIDYDPLVSVKRVKDRRKREREEKSDLGAALIETVKYSVKASDSIQDRGFLYGITEQIKRMRFLDSGGCFRGIFKDKQREAEAVSDEDMLLKSDESSGERLEKLFFVWDGIKNYRLKK